MSDEDEYQDLTDIAEEWYELEYPSKPLGHYRVTLSSGNNVSVYTTEGGAKNIVEEGFEIHNMTDDDIVEFRADHTRYSAEELTAQPAAMPVDQQTPRRPRPKLHGRVGQHRDVDPSTVASLDAQRSKPAKGQPSMPFGYEPKDKVSKLPRHRRRS